MKKLHNVYSILVKDKEDGITPIVKVMISRARTQDLDHSSVSDPHIAIFRGSGSVPAECLGDLIDALTQVQVRHKRWVEEGTNWNIEEGEE